MRYQNILLLFVILMLNACGEEGSNNTATTEDKPAAAGVTFSQDVKGQTTTVKGIITGLDKPQKIFIDEKKSDAFDIKGSVMTSMDGEFSLDIGIEKPAIYRIRIGRSPLLLVLKGGEDANLEISLDQQKKIQSFSISGSESSNVLATLGNDEAQIKSYLAENAGTADALVQLALVERLDILKEVAHYQSVEAALKDQYPNSSYILPLGTKITQAIEEINRPKIEIGEEAPDITMTDVDGKERSLSDLRGKVVLLDFWASWCGPCRHENPNVVRAYNKYKRKGFEVFSVSLDGLTDKDRLMLNNPERFDQELESRRGKWLAAIEQDGLVWDNHVSELRSWDTDAAKMYEVSGIPRTFLIDQEGIIRAVNPRGAALEKNLKELL